MSVRLRSLALALLVAASLLPGCASKHRPSVVTSAPGAGARTEEGAPQRPSDAPLPVDSGPDVRPLHEEGAAAADLTGGESGEGGPLADVPFDYDKATLSDEATATLQRHAQWLKQHADTKVVVEGHCDQRGTVEYNLALGEARARAVREYLVAQGVAAERLTSVSYGKERPLDTGSNAAAWARNRRAHFVVSR